MTHVLINGRYVLQPLTGVQRYAREMVSALKGLAPPDFTFTVAEPDAARVRSRLAAVLWEGGLGSEMRRVGADLLWSPANTGPLGVEAQVVTIHDASVFACPEGYAWSFRTYHRWKMPRLGRRVRRVVTDSEFSKAELVRYGIAPAEKIRVVYPGVGPAFRPQPREGMGYVLFVGTRSPRKNLRRLIEAWGRVPAAAKAGRILRVVGGTGPAFAAEPLAALPVDVRLEGYVGESELPAVYAGADLLVMPSLYEGFGLPVLEAMACGVPVVAARAASLREVCGEAAEYCDPSDTADITRAVEGVMADPARRRTLAEQGIARAEAFRWEGAAERLVAVFEDALAAR